MPFANFLTFVVDKISLLRKQSATTPLTTVTNHENTKGSPDHTPFYNETGAGSTRFAAHDVIGVHNSVSYENGYTGVRRWRGNISDVS